MFDIVWYKNLLTLAAKAVMPVVLTPMSTAQRRSDTSFQKKIHIKSYYELDDNLIDFAEYFESYLSYFNLEFKNDFNEKITNKQIGRWSN